MVMSFSVSFNHGCMFVAKNKFWSHVRKDKSTKYLIANKLLVRGVWILHLSIFVNSFYLFLFDLIFLLN